MSNSKDFQLDRQSIWEYLNKIASVFYFSAKTSETDLIWLQLLNGMCLEQSLYLLIKINVQF